MKNRSIDATSAAFGDDFAGWGPRGTRPGSAVEVSLDSARFGQPMIGKNPPMRRKRKRSGLYGAKSMPDSRAHVRLSIVQET